MIFKFWLIMGCTSEFNSRMKKRDFMFLYLFYAYEVSKLDRKKFDKWIFNYFRSANVNISYNHVEWFFLPFQNTRLNDSGGHKLALSHIFLNLKSESGLSKVCLKVCDDNESMTGGPTLYFRFIGTSIFIEDLGGFEILMYQPLLLHSLDCCWLVGRLVGYQSPIVFIFWQIVGLGCRVWYVCRRWGDNLWLNCQFSREKCSYWYKNFVLVYMQKILFPSLNMDRYLC